MGLHDVIGIAGVGETCLEMTHPDGAVAVAGQAGHIIRGQRELFFALVSQRGDRARVLIIYK